MSPDKRVKKLSWKFNKAKRKGDLKSFIKGLVLITLNYGGMPSYACHPTQLNGVHILYHDYNIEVISVFKCMYIYID